MRLAEYLCPACTLANLTAHDKAQALQELARAANVAGLDSDEVYAVLAMREAMGSTAVGNGIAIPHGKIPGLEKMVLTFARSPSGVDFAAPDGKICHLFFTVLAPTDAAGQHLGLLGCIARLVRDTSFTDRLLQTESAAELAAFLANT